MDLVVQVAAESLADRQLNKNDRYVPEMATVFVAPERRHLDKGEEA